MRIPVPRRPGEDTTRWRCPACKTPMATSARDFEWELAELESKIGSARKRGDVPFLEAFLRDRMYPRGRLHPTHELVLDVQYALVTTMYGQLEGFQMKDI
ncbi:SCL-interrupting locus protein-like protein [Frankliniella fusca]|uniref:SCL-interrupting locus protein-like protein n=1 Tax=Frankliniella fusca TaxID=407009 RepID=A0AAE1HFF8_9NEOP|nr:SCL-interrupting locus protein-like protein [Frankliniella fusca]